MNTKTEEKHILMTGGTGFFGKSLLDLVGRGAFPGFRFTLTSRNAGRFSETHPEWRSPRVRFLSADVRTMTFPAEPIDFVIHAATAAVLPERSPDQVDVILSGTRRVLAESVRTHVKRVLFISSGAVYGIQKSEFQSEETELLPVTSYGRAKLEAERLCLDSKVECVIARCFAFIGRHLPGDLHFAAGNFMRDALAGKEIVIRGDGTPLRSWMYADDLVKALMNLLSHGRAREAYNVGSEAACSIRELALLIAELSGGRSSIKILGTPIPGAIPERYVPSIRKLGALPDSAPLLGVREAVQKTLEQKQLQQGE